MCIYIYIINVSIYIYVHAHTKYCRCILHIWIETNLPWQSVAVLPGSGTKTSLKPATKRWRTVIQLNAFVQLMSFLFDSEHAGYPFGIVYCTQDV